MKVPFCIFLFVCSNVLALGETINVGTLYLGGAVPPTPPAITNTTLGLVNWWPMDENMGTTTADLRGGDNGSFQGTPTWVPGVVGSALNFDGTASLACATNTSVGAGAFSLCVWLKRAGDNVNGNGYAMSDDVDTSSGFDFLGDSGPASGPAGNGEASLQILTDANYETRSSVSNCVPIGTWVHVIATWDGNLSDFHGIQIYTNTGQVPYDTTWDQNGTGTHLANTLGSSSIAVLVGRGNTFKYNGSIDDLRLYNRVLAAGERTNIFKWRGQP